MEGGRRRARKRTRRTALLLLGLGVVGGGFVMLFVASFPDVQELDQAVFVGSVTPGPHVVPINETGFAWVEITGEVLPCGLSIHALTPAQLDLFNETLILPPGGIDCDNPTALVRAAATHVVLHNQDTTDAFAYRVRATYFTFTEPFAWLAFPGLGVILAGIFFTGAQIRRG